MSGASATVAGVEVPTDHYIGGRRVGSAERFATLSPYDESVLAEVARGDAQTADAALTAAAEAFPAWAALGAVGRAEHLHRLADRVDARREELAAVESADMAMLLESLKLRVIARAAMNFRSYADLAVAHEERDWHSKGTWNRVQRMPAGPAVIITPWNAPFMLSTWKISPALAAGCPVVLKPAEWSPLSCSLLGELCDEAGMPPGVLNVVQGLGEEVGAALTADERARRISFTGSPETARLIGVEAARNLVPFTGELGGKGPFVVFADADLDLAARRAAGQYDDAGQVCLAGTRLLVEDEVLEAFLERFDAEVARHVMGDPADSATTLTPLIHREHLERVDGFVQRAVAEGHELLRGGTRGERLFYPPTLIRPKDNDAEIVQREVFGPVLTLQTFSGEDEAVALANSTAYGLSALLFTGSMGRADRVGRAVRAGVVWVNTFLVRDLTAPFGG
ncbi:MAG: aldehyde dehydrogenase family protein, partial [Solirubrobacterales bacterium]|nr:aldehyde dehydrogenase family protein [Solirubrobacterales bacterium]